MKSLIVRTQIYIVYLLIINKLVTSIFSLFYLNLNNIRVNVLLALPIKPFMANF